MIDCVNDDDFASFVSASCIVYDCDCDCDCVRVCDCEQFYVLQT